MKPIRILIVEDNPKVLKELEGMYREVFAALGYQPAVEQAISVSEARQLAKEARSKPYDFVSLDVNLGDSTLTGLDVLSTFKRFQSAWMVALLTGVESDVTVDKTMGAEKGELLRTQLRRDAYARFPAERLLVVEKPSSSLSLAESRRLLSNRLEQIAHVYEEVGRLRYVFRPIEVAGLQRVPSPKGRKAQRRFLETTALHWQIRYDCGEIRTLPDMAGFRTLHYILSRDRDQSVTPEEALANEPKGEASKPQISDAQHDPIADYFRAQGIEWANLSAMEQDKMIRAALSLKLRRYIELRGYGDEGDITPSEQDALSRIINELGPLADAAEAAYLSMQSPCEPQVAEPSLTAAGMVQDGLHIDGGNFDRLGLDRRGLDSPAAQLFRARMKRVRDCLRENGFSDFAQHIESFVQSTGANWSYNRPENVEWTT